LGQFVGQQAFIQGVDDVFMLAAIIVLVSVIPVFFLRKRRKQDAKALAAMD
jgi:DHA2 family multidrug resistance protein